MGEGMLARFSEYVKKLAGVLGHADRVEPMKDYCTALIMPIERKSVEPLAAVIAPERTSAAHQSLLHFIGQSAWSDEAMLAKTFEHVVPAFKGTGGVEAWIVDDTGMTKKGKHSVGVARQYCGRLGKTDNCQVAVSLSVANHAVSIPVAYRLYLNEEWAGDKERRKKVHVPDDIEFATKPEISLRQIKAAVAAGVPKAVVLGDAGYGSDGEFRDGVAALDMCYAVGVQPFVAVWPPGCGPLPPKEWCGRGRKPKRVRRDAEHKPVSAKALAISLPDDAWKEIAWREGTNDTLSSRFALLRVRTASTDWNIEQPQREEWLVIEWPPDEKEPTKYFLSNLPADISPEKLIDTIKLRWRIERDYEELKGEFGLAHFEGRGWRGFHHHASMCIASYAFLISERSAFPPSGNPFGSEPAIPAYRRPVRAASQNGKARVELDRDDPASADRRACADDLSLSVLQNPTSGTERETPFVTQ